MGLTPQFFARGAVARPTFPYLKVVMTNTIAVFLALLIIGFVMLDHFVLDWGVPAFVLRRLIDLIDYIAFWR